jgi:hypothetical protein
MVDYFLRAPEKLFTILAIIATAGFFGWKIFAGWLIINLEIDIQLARQTKDDTEYDWLSIVLLLKKGPTDGLWLRDIVVRIYDSNKQLLQEIKDIQEYNSVAITNNKIDYIKPPKNKRKYTIAPNEVFRYGIIREIKAEMPVIVEGAVYGKRPFWKKGFQWRASVISLPVNKKSKAASA